MSKSVDVPTDYTIHSVMSGSLDLDLDNIHLSVEKIPTISLNTQSKLDSRSKLESTSTVDLGLDDIRIKELPKIDLRVEMAVKPMRVHFPVNYKFGLCSMGLELIAFHVCGESMVVIEDYVPHKAEICV